MTRRNAGVILAAVVAIAAGTFIKKNSKPKEPAAPLKWTFGAGKTWLSSPALADDGTVYVSSETGLDAVNADGIRKWHFDAYNVISSPAVADDGIIYFIGRMGLYAVNPTGKAVWSSPRAFSPYHGYFSPLVLGSDVVYVNSTGGITAVRTVDSEPIWATEDLRACDMCAPAIGRDGTIFLSEKQRGLSAVGSDGTIKWQSESSDGDLGSPAVTANNTIILGAATHGAFAVNTDGSEIWGFPTKGPVKASPVIDRAANVYFGTEDGTFYAVAGDGVKQWEFRASGSIIGSAALASDGTVYFGTNGNVFYALKPDGTVKWRFATKDAVVTSPTISADGTVYVLDHSGTLYAFGENNGGLMDSAWPKYKHDARNTGVAR